MSESDQLLQRFNSIALSTKDNGKIDYRCREQLACGHPRPPKYEFHPKVQEPETQQCSGTANNGSVPCFGQVLKSGGRSRCLNVLCQDTDTAPRTRLSRCHAPVDPEKQSFRRGAARAASERSGTSNAFSVIGSSVSGG